MAIALSATVVATSCLTAHYHGRVENRSQHGADSPWLQVPLDDYEAHMSHEQVDQLGPLRALFGEAVAMAGARSVAVVGVAGGNGLEVLDAARTKRIVGVDIHPDYLAAVARRYGHLPGLELHCVDLARERLRCRPVTLVHAALIFEHAGAGRCLDHALALVSRRGWFSVVLQLPSDAAAGVSATGIASIQMLKERFSLIDPAWMLEELERRGFLLKAASVRDLAGGKALWHGMFRRGAEGADPCQRAPRAVS